MLSRIRSAAVLGVDAYPVEVEVHLAPGLPSFTTVGLPHGAVKEGRERVASAIVNSGFEVPLKRIVANLSPADVPKAGSAFDLPTAVGILAASGQIQPVDLAGGLCFGELGLEGDLRPLRGTLSLVACAKQAGAHWVVLPEPNQREGALIDGIRIFGARTLRDVVAHLEGRSVPMPKAEQSTVLPARSADETDFAEVRGQRAAKRALEVAAAGGHNVLMVGPPGSGKTMLARRLPSLLPSLDQDEALEVTRIHSVAGLLPAWGGLVTSRPFRAPHHTVSDAGMSGGGSHPRPGEVSLAHHGVLFLDELLEFRRNVLEVLRQPLEDGHVTLSRAAVTVNYPARFMLAAAMNPCPCGFLDDPAKACLCSPERVRSYRARLSGPLYDRIDFHVSVPALAWQELADPAPLESSKVIRSRVEAARARQRDRLRGRAGIRTNAHLQTRDIDRWCRPDADGRRLLEAAMHRMGWSARAYARVLKVARTVADLEAAEVIRAPHVAEAVQYRILDRSRAADA